MIDKGPEEEIKALKKAKKYEDIYRLYGSKAYVKSSPRFYMRKLILKLIKEGRYEEIKPKFGQLKYEAYLPLIMRNQVLTKTQNRFLANLAYVKGKIKRGFTYLIIGTAIALPTSTGKIIYDHYEEKNAIIEENKEIIEAYNEDLEEYASYIRSLNLTQKEIIVKVMSDIYEKYKYKHPEGDKNGFYRYFLYENGYGVCRNFTDDFCAKLNAIQPDFEAHSVFCKMNHIDENGEIIHYSIMDNIDRTIEDDDEENPIIEESRFFNADTLGNHMVAVINIKGEPVPLVVDPTNPGMGALINGDIHMFYADKEALATRPLSDIFLTEGSIIHKIKDLLNSIEFRNKEEDLRERYGTPELEKTLDQVREKEQDIRRRENREEDFEIWEWDISLGQGLS